MKPSVTNILQVGLTDLRQHHATTLTFLRELSESVKAARYTKEVLSDLVLLLKDYAELADDLKKETNAIMEDAGDSAALMWTLEATASGNTKPIRGELSTGSVTQKVFPKLPSKSREPERHHQLMEGLILDLIEERQSSVVVTRREGPVLHLDIQLPLLKVRQTDCEIFSISWPRLVDKLSIDYAAGKPLPAGLTPEDLSMKPKLSVRRCKE